MNMLEKRLYALEQAATPLFHRSMTDAELAIRLHAMLQPGHPRNGAAWAWWFKLAGAMDSSLDADS